MTVAAMGSPWTADSRTSFWLVASLGTAELGFANRGPSGLAVSPQGQAWRALWTQRECWGAEMQLTLKLPTGGYGAACCGAYTSQS